jgi:hypothetical protein
MDDDNNKNYFRFQQPLQSDITSYVIFYGSISVIIFIIIFIFLVIFSSDDSQQPQQKSVYSNRYYNSSLDDNSMTFSSFKTIKGGVKKIKCF